jgi:hypothetical protein
MREAMKGQPHKRWSVSVCEKMRKTGTPRQKVREKQPSPGV